MHPTDQIEDTVSVDLGAICRRIMFVDDATEILTEHAAFVWNKAGTRIRCTGCPEILDVPGGPESGDAVAAFARHQAEQLPEPDPAPEAAQPTDDPEQDSEPEGEQDTPEPAGEEPMEQALSEAALAVTDQAPAPKVRRDTKALTATIAELNKGDRVSAGFNHPRYGIFAVEGTVTKGGAGQDRNQLMVGGWHINLNARAAKYLWGLQVIAPAGSHEFTIPKPSELTDHVGIGG